MTIRHTLSSGHIVLIDEEDAHLLDKYYFTKIQSKESYTPYVSLKDKVTREYSGLLHRVIMNASPKILIDHKDGNGLNCCRENLRVATHAQNQYNRRPTVNKTKGVYFRADRNKWSARISVNDKIVHIGVYETEDEAIKARKAAELFYYGEFAGLGTANL